MPTKSKCINAFLASSFYSQIPVESVELIDDEILLYCQQPLVHIYLVRYGSHVFKSLIF